MKVIRHQIVDLSAKKLTKIPPIFRGIRLVNSSFLCSRKKLTDLENSPAEIDADFYASTNKLTSLRGGPTKVGSLFPTKNRRAARLIEGNADRIPFL